MTSDSVGDIGEFALIQAVVADLPQHSGVVVGPGDDAAVIAAPDGRIVVSTDMLIERQHFRRDWSSAHDIGRKAAAQNLADVVAMGARPTAITVGLAMPPDLSVEWVHEFRDGLRAECEVVGASVVGGDMTRGDAIAVSVTALGDLEGREPVTRAGARAGNVIALCGRLGWSEAGYRVLSRGFRNPRVLVDAHRVPDIAYDAGPEAADLGATAMCDISDGLLADLGHIAKASGTAIDVNTKELEVAEPLRDIAGALGADPMQWVLAGGEDHALAAAFPAGVDLPRRWRPIGKVAEGEGITVDGDVWDGEAGYTHFG